MNLEELLTTGIGEGRIQFWKVFVFDTNRAFVGFPLPFCGGEGFPDYTEN